MCKVRALIGMPVVCEDRRIGRVLQADLSDDLGQLSGLWISRGLRGARYIPSESLQMLGSVAVLTDSPGVRRRARMRPLFRRAVSTDGARLGAVTGAEVDELSFRVVSLELSSGLWDDLANGRRRVTRYVVNRDRSVVILDPTETEMEAEDDEGRYDEGTADRHADRRLGGDDIRRDELADGAPVESQGEAVGELDL